MEKSSHWLYWTKFVNRAYLDTLASKTSRTMASPSQWSVGQLVNVQPRTWAGINRPGGVGKISKLHYSNGFVESLDVKYVVGGGSDAKLDLDFVEAYEPLEANGRSRRGRDLYSASPAKREVSQDATDRQPAKKQKKKSTKSTNDKVKKGKKVAPKATDENVDPKGNKTVHRKVKSTVKKTPCTKKTDKAKNPPATHVILKKNRPVSPLRDTPLELRGEKKKSSKSKKSSTKFSARPTTVSYSSKTASTGQQNQGDFVIKKASRPKESVARKKPVSLVAKCKPKRAQARPLPLKRVYDAQVDRANDFVEGLVGKPKSTSLPESNEQEHPEESTVTMSPPNTVKTE